MRAGLFVPVGELGKQVTFVDIPGWAMRDVLVGFGLPEWQADGLVEDYAHYRRGETSTVSTAVRARAQDYDMG
jgi:hypothetical protein